MQVDSIPAVFGVTRDPFIVFSSNLFAILGKVLFPLFFISSRLKLTNGLIYPKKNGRLVSALCFLMLGASP